MTIVKLHDRNDGDGIVAWWKRNGGSLVRLSVHTYYVSSQSTLVSKCSNNLVVKWNLLPNTISDAPKASRRAGFLPIYHSW